MGDVYMPWPIEATQTFGLAYYSSNTLKEWYWLKTMNKTTCTCLLWMGDVKDQDDTNTLKAWPFKHSKELYKKVCNQKQNCMSLPMNGRLQTIQLKRKKKLKKRNQDSYMNS